MQVRVVVSNAEVTSTCARKPKCPARVGPTRRRVLVLRCGVFPSAAILPDSWRTRVTVRRRAFLVRIPYTKGCRSVEPAPIQQKIKDFFGDHDTFLHQEGNSLKAGGIGYGLLRQADAMKRLKELKRFAPR